MATWTSETRNISSWTSENKSTTSSGSIVIGNPIGLLLSLTYAVAVGGSPLAWTSENKNLSTWTGENKN